TARVELQALDDQSLQLVQHFLRGHPFGPSATNAGWRSLQASRARSPRQVPDSASGSVRASERQRWTAASGGPPNISPPPDRGTGGRSVLRRDATRTSARPVRARARGSPPSRPGAPGPVAGPAHTDRRTLRTPPRSTPARGRTPRTRGGSRPARWP